MLAELAALEENCASQDALSSARAAAS